VLALMLVCLGVCVEACFRKSVLEYKRDACTCDFLQARLLTCLRAGVHAGTHACVESCLRNSFLEWRLVSVEPC
jgi:hypothetical protein